MPEPWGIGTKASRVSRATVGMDARKPTHGAAGGSPRRDADDGVPSRVWGRPQADPTTDDYGTPSRTGASPGRTRRVAGQRPGRARAPRGARASVLGALRHPDRARRAGGHAADDHRLGRHGRTAPG